MASFFFCHTLLLVAKCPDPTKPEAAHAWARNATDDEKVVCRSNVEWIGSLLYANARMYDKRVEGASGQIVRQKKIHGELAKARNPMRICETGFNAGHSAASWLLSAPTAKYQGFDAGEMFHKYPRKNLELLRLLFGRERVSVEFGDSRKTIPLFTNKVGHFICDLIHVDGGHFDDVPYEDLRNFRKLADKDTVLIMDDIHCDPRACLHDKSGCKVPMMEWAAATRGFKLDKPWIKEVACHNFKGESTNKYSECRGHCYGDKVYSFVILCLCLLT